MMIWSMEAKVGKCEIEIQVEIGRKMGFGPNKS